MIIIGDADDGQERRGGEERQVRRRFAMRCQGRQKNRSLRRNAKPQRLICICEPSGDFAAPLSLSLSKLITMATFPMVLLLLLSCSLLLLSFSPRSLSVKAAPRAAPRAVRPSVRTMLIRVCDKLLQSVNPPKLASRATRQIRIVTFLATEFQYFSKAFKAICT